MEKINCGELGLKHKYGLWNLENDNNVSRTCDVCNAKEKLPITTETLEEIKKQIEANKLITAFMTLSINDINLIGYLNVILSDAVNYLDKEQKQSLLTKLRDIELNSSLTVENISFINNFIISIKENDIEAFYDTYDEFVEYNDELLSVFQVEESQAHAK